MTSSSSPSVSAPAWTWRTPTKSTAAVPTASVRPTSSAEHRLDDSDAGRGRASPGRRAGDEALLLALLLAERLDDTQRRQHLLDDGQRGALELLDLA